LGSGHALMTHAGFALIATTFVLIAAFSLIRVARDSGGNRTLKKIGTFMMHGVGPQVVLGLAAFFRPGSYRGGAVRVVMRDKLAEAPPLPLVNVVIATAHQLIGACLLMAAALGAVWVRRVRTEPRAE